ESVGNVLHAAMRRQSADFATGRSNAPPERFSGMSLKSFGMSATVSGTAAPRKAKERKDGRSMELMDLAFSNKMQLGPDGQYVQQYTPISLPYFDIQEEGEASTDAPTQAQTRPKLMHIDEANSRAAAKLLGAQQELLEDTYFLMQMPCVLPEMRNPEDEVFREQEDALSAGAGSTITRLPDGKLGKLRIYKSGKVRMEIAGVSFCVDQGCDTFFQQDLALVCPLAGEIFNLGNINTRMVLTPDLDSILKDVPQQMPEDLPEEPRVTRVDRKDRPARKRCYDSEVFRGEGFPRKDFYIYFSRVSLVPYRVVAVVSLYHKNWLKLHRRP
ncbi:unnamed protein product, partial [Cladocopium goreaui]